MILKIQRPINDPEGMLLIYNQARTIAVTRPPLPAVLDLMGDRYKIYAEAVLRPGDLYVQRVIEDQDW